MTAKHIVKDCLGNVLKVGDRIAYAQNYGQNGSLLKIARVIEVLPKTLRCQPEENLRWRDRKFIAHFPMDKVVRLEEAKDGN